MESPVPDLERLRLRERPSGLPVMRQRWQQLAFLHWSVDPIALSALLPPGVELDTWQGKAYVGIVPFGIRRSRAAFLPAIPGLSDFNELNVRTYVHRHGRDPGVWFFSLDAASRLAVWGARAVYKLPYFHASIALERSGDRTSFSSVRRASPKAQAGPNGQGRQNGQDGQNRQDDGRPRFACSYQPDSVPAPVPPGTLEFFLIERYLLYSWDGRRLRKARVWHHPYPVAEARIDGLSEDVGAAAGLQLDPDSAPIAHHVEEVDVRIYPPTLVRLERDQRADSFSIVPEPGTPDAELAGAVAATSC